MLLLAPYIGACCLLFSVCVNIAACYYFNKRNKSDYNYSVKMHHQIQNSRTVSAKLGDSGDYDKTKVSADGKFMTGNGIKSNDIQIEDMQVGPELEMDIMGSAISSVRV